MKTLTLRAQLRKTSPKTRFNSSAHRWFRTTFENRFERSKNKEYGRRHERFTTTTDVAQQRHSHVEADPCFKLPATCTRKTSNKCSRQRRSTTASSNTFHTLEISALIRPKIGLVLRAVSKRDLLFSCKEIIFISLFFQILFSHAFLFIFSCFFC